MGMFDEICCKYPLPIEVPAWVDWFQTKDLDNSLSRFEITTDGRLIELANKPPTWNYREPADWSDYHADLHFYTSKKVALGQDGKWNAKDTGDHYEYFEFTARFTDGKLTRIRLTKHSIEPITPVQMD